LAAGPRGADVPTAVRRKLHQTIRGVAIDIEELRYNTAISKLMEYVNVARATCAEGAGATIPPEAVAPLAVMLSPFAPHFAEECWERLGHTTTVLDAGWPVFDEALAQEDEVELVVQVNGKVRGRIQVARGTAEAEAVKRALADEGVRRFVDGQKIRKTVFVPDRLINLVV
jgi:leucyl-tRNA synthetase